MAHSWREYLFLDAVWQCDNCGKLCKETDFPKDQECDEVVYLVGYNGCLPNMVFKSRKAAKKHIQSEGQTEDTMYIDPMVLKEE